MHVHEETTIVDNQYAKYKDILLSLEKTDDMSLLTNTNDTLQKAFVLCVASYFEKCLTNSVKQYVKEVSGGSQVLLELLDKKAIKRQYHTWFSWETQNANQFFSMFGKDFCEYMKNVVKADAKISQSIRDFLEIGNDRNSLIHNDFGAASFNKTLDEVYVKYKSAFGFVVLFPEVFRKHELGQVVPAVEEL